MSDQIPRAERTIFICVARVHHDIREIYATAKPGGEGSAFFDGMLKDMLAHPAIDGDAFHATVGDPEHMASEEALVIATAWTVQAVRLARLGQTQEAWSCIVDAADMVGRVRGSRGATQQAIEADPGNKGRNSRWAINRAQKRLVYAWAEANKHRYPPTNELNEMALQIVADRVTDLDLQRVRKHLTDWKAGVVIPDD